MAYAPDLDDLAKFVEKALEIQLSDLDEPLTEKVLAKIARKAGLSDDDWKRVCSRLEEHLQKGRNFLTFENYGDAIIELEQAAALAPYRAEVLCDCGKAHLKNWKERGVKKSRERSEEFLLRSLEIDPVNVEAAELLSEHRKPDPETFTRGKKTAIVAAALSLTVASWIGISSLPTETAHRNEEVTVHEIQFGNEAAPTQQQREKMPREEAERAFEEFLTGRTLLFSIENYLFEYRFDPQGKLTRVRIQEGKDVTEVKYSEWEVVGPNVADVNHPDGAVEKFTFTSDTEAKKEFFRGESLRSTFTATLKESK